MLSKLKSLQKFKRVLKKPNTLVYSFHTNANLSFKSRFSRDAPRTEKAKIEDPDYIPDLDSIENLFKNASKKLGINFDQYNDEETEVEGMEEEKEIEDIKSIAELPKSIQVLCKKCGFETLTPVQKKCIPIIQKKKDLIACSQTGSGKTAAFLFPVICNLLTEKKKQTKSSSNDNVRFRRKNPFSSENSSIKPRCLIIGPTRELVTQIFDEIRKFTYKTNLRGGIAFGGANANSQLEKMRDCDILVGTPGRLLDFAESGRINLKEIEYLIFDEADRMLDMGFEKDIRKIENYCTSTKDRVTSMFSATFPERIRNLAKDFLSRDHVFAKFGVVGGAAKLVTQNFEKKYSDEDKFESLLDFVEKNPRDKIIIFCDTKRKVIIIDEELEKMRLNVSSLHGDKSQRSRDISIRDYKNGRSNILIATDIAARGLDIDKVQHVINFDCPRDIDSYVHRIGRTGRVGNKGSSLTYMTNKDRSMANNLIKILRDSNQKIPMFLQEWARNQGFSSSFGNRNFTNRNTVRKNDMGNKKRLDIDFDIPDF